MSDYTLIKIDQLPPGTPEAEHLVMFGIGDLIYTCSIEVLLGLLPASNPNVRPRLQDLNLTVLEANLPTFLNSVNVTIANGEVVFLRFSVIREGGLISLDTYAIPLSSGTYNPIGTTIDFNELILINQEEVTVGGNANTIVYEVVSLSALNNADPAFDLSDDTKEYIIIIGGSPYLFIGLNGFYGLDELTMVEGDLQALSSLSGVSVWGAISGTLSDQTDLQNALDLKENESNKATDLTSPDDIKYPTTLAVQNALSAIDFEISNVLETELLENALIWCVPPASGNYGSATSPFRVPTTMTVQNNGTDSFFGPLIAPLETTAVAGTGGGTRRIDGLNFNLFSNFVFVRDFRVDNNISNDCRYIVGISKNYQFAFPTNNDPSVHTECIYVAKLSTSNNLHIVHNDNTGTATTIDLGVNFPANSDLYKYRFYLTKRSASDYDVQIFRRTLSTGVILESSIYHLTTNLPTAGGVLQQILFIINNATPTNMRLGDYGFINKLLPL